MRVSFHATPFSLLFSPRHIGVHESFFIPVMTSADPKVLGPFSSIYVYNNFIFDCYDKFESVKYRADYV
jgi:hypothetical protein